METATPRRGLLPDDDGDNIFDEMVALNNTEYLPFFIHSTLPDQTDGVRLCIGDGEVTYAEVW